MIRAAPVREGRRYLSTGRCFFVSGSLALAHHGYKRCVRGGVRLPRGYHSVSTRAFFGEPSVHSIMFPCRVRRVKGGTFRKYSQLDEVRLPRRLRGLNVKMFSSYVSLGGIGVPTDLADVPGGTFGGNQGLGDLRFTPGDGLAFVNPGTFSRYTALARIIFPTSLRRVSSETFCGYGGLDYVSFPKKSLEIVKGRTFCFYKVSSLRLPSSLRILSRDTFFGYYGLASIIVPPGIECLKG